jgi:putative DNA primase/helicase
MSACSDAAMRLKATVCLPTIIGETLALKRDGKTWTAPCPFHAERTPSFHVYQDHFHCFGCGEHGDVFDWLEKQRGLSFRDAIEYLGGGGEAPVQCHGAVTLVSLPECEPDNTMPLRRELAQRIWSEAVDPRGTIVERYLAVRGVPLPDADVLRFHPHCPRKGGNLPAMVALMTEPLTDEFRGVHRTFLKPDGSGKAEVDKPKMMLGGAGIIQLVDLQEIGVGLGLAEGIETALSVMQTIGWGPVWAAGSAGAIKDFPVLRATTLNIFTDSDGTGLKAAQTCSSRWAEAGAEVFIHEPPDGKDWNDAAIREIRLHDPVR